MMQALLPFSENHICPRRPDPYWRWATGTKEKQLSDSKELYSEASRYYIEVDVQQNQIDSERYERSKQREETYNDLWVNNSVNINEIVDRFAPHAKAKRHGVKYEFEGERYVVKADMPSGYLRVFDKETYSYVDLDGNPSINLDSTHFKILKREEM